MSRRKLTDADLRDWSRLTQSVRPLAKKSQGVPKADQASKKHLRTDRAGAEAEHPQTKRKPAPAVPAAPVQAANEPKRQLPGLDQFATRSIRRGGGPDARIDLHGLTQGQAHQRLLGFLRNAQRNGARIVLVITGKGKSPGTGDWWAQGDRGVLRRAVPGWLSTQPFRSLVAGYQSASRGHGGEGAFFVQLRSSRRTEGKPS